MPRTKILVSALALALAGTTTAQAQTFTSVISFGDSLSDAGQYAALPPPYAFGAGSFTTNPDDVWVQLVAQAFGLTSTASMAGGTNYAWGGAPTSFNVPGVPLPLFCVPSTLPCRSAAQQIADAGPVDPNALYTYYADANDIFNYVGYVGAGYINSAQAQAYTGASAMNAVGQIAGLQGAGAKVIVVLNLPDIGRTPNFNNAALFPGQATPANASALSGLTFIHNTTLNAGLGTLGDGIVPINVYAMFNEILADPSAYGFTNTTGTACDLTLSGGSSLFCTPAAYRSPDANDTYVFADGVHPSGASHRMLASVVVSTLTAPGQVSMAGELPLQVYDDHSSAINDQIFNMNSAARFAGESNVYGQVQYSQTEFNATGTTNSMDSDLFSATFGGDVRASDNFSVGAAVTVGSSDGDSGRASIGGTEVLASVYGIGHFGAGYLDAILSYGSNSLSIDRAIVLGAATRIENGSTNASHMAAELGAGFTFGSDAFKHGPFVSWTWQEVSVDGYAEDAVDSTAMYFNEFDRKSSVGRVGYQASGTSGSWQPYGRIAFAYEEEDDVIAVQAGSNTLNGHFTLDGFQPASDWAEADLGVIYQLNEGTSLSFGYRGRFSDDTQDVNSVNFGARWEFGESAPAPEPVAAPAEKTCSDLDDDGDGVNNCDDKCPGSEAGQAIGPDGCPVPLTIDLKGVNFDFDKDTLRPDAVAILDEAISILGKYPELKVEVAGHTDSKGTDEYNQALSERRARTVYDYLGSHGIGAERLVGPVGYGESKPIAPNANEDGSDNPEGRAQNRRTELNVQN